MKKFQRKGASLRYPKMETLQKLPAIVTYHTICVLSLHVSYMFFKSIIFPFVDFKFKVGAPESNEPVTLLFMPLMLQTALTCALVK